MTRAVVAMALLAAFCCACDKRSAVPPAAPRPQVVRAVAPRSPVLLVCSAKPRMPADPQAIERLAWGLWIPTLTAEARASLLAALENATSNLETAAFGAEDLLDEAPGAPLIACLNQIGSGLIGARALAALTVGATTPEGVATLLPECPTRVAIDCQCGPLSPGQTWPPAVRAHAWAATESAGVALPDGGTLEALARLDACAKAPQSAIGFIPRIWLATQFDDDTLIAKASRLGRRIALLPDDDETIRARELVDGMAHPTLNPPPWLADGAAGFVLIVPKLSRIAGRPLEREVANCMARSAPSRPSTAGREPAPGKAQRAP
jgi:hypothetical protein